MHRTLVILSFLLLNTLESVTSYDSLPMEIHFLIFDKLFVFDKFMHQREPDLKTLLKIARINKRASHEIKAYIAFKRYCLDLSHRPYSQVLNALKGYASYPVEKIFLRNLQPDIVEPKPRLNQRPPLQKIVNKLEHFKESLKELDLSRNDLAFINLDALGSLTQLSDLDLSHSNLVKVPPCSTKLKNLESLFLSDNQLSKRDVPRLIVIVKKNKKLEELDLEDNKLLDKYGLGIYDSSRKYILKILGKNLINYS